MHSLWDLFHFKWHIRVVQELMVWLASAASKQLLNHCLSAQLHHQNDNDNHYHHHDNNYLYHCEQGGFPLFIIVVTLAFGLILEELRT